MSKLKKLLDRCKCGVYLTVNQHRDYYESAEEALMVQDSQECPTKLGRDVRKVMIDTDTVINLQLYPDTPIGSYSILHYDLDLALDDALECLGIAEDTLQAIKGDQE